MKTKLTKTQTDFLNQNTDGTWKLNSKTGLIDIEGDFYCADKGLKDFKGIKFGVVTEDFYCLDNKLTSLEGAPQEVKGSFDCKHNKLTNLVGAPQKVGENFDCSHNKLTSLEGAPQEVGETFDCYNNQLTSLVGAPQEVKYDFNCSHNELTSLVGAPQKVIRFDCSHNKLTSLEGAPQEVINFYCYNNQLTSLEGAPQKGGGVFRCEKNSISEEFLQMIWKKMKNGTPYDIALASLKKVFQEKKEKEIQKINSKYDPILSQIDDGVAKGASLLGRFEVI